MKISNDRARGQRLYVAGMVLAASLVAASCGGGDEAASESASSTAPPTTGDVQAGVDCPAVPTGVSQFVLDAGGAEHDVRVYVPTTHDGTSELPLVINFHGFGSNGDQQAAFTGYEELAEEEGFVVVHPTAVPSTSEEDGRNSWETVAVDDPAKDDVAFVHELLDVLIEDYCVDETRLYATGMSGGGLFTSQLVCEMSDRLAAAVSVAAISYPQGCDPAEPVPFRAIHGTEDPTVPFDGDPTGTRFEGEEFVEVLFSEPMPDQFAQFAEAMGCDPEGERVQTSTDVVTTTYSGCDDDVPLAFYEVVEGGHAWPSSPLAEPESPIVEQLTALQGYTTFDIDATADSWAFFQQHSRDA
jgi:polyhydroxybutyrate depolymerase